MRVCLWAARSSLSQGSSFHHFFRILLCLKIHGWSCWKLIYNFGHYSTAESFPWGRFFFPVWFAGRGLGWLWIKNIWIKFSRGVGGGGPVPAVRNVLAFLPLGEKRKHCLHGYPHFMSSLSSLTQCPWTNIYVNKK